MRAMGFLIQRRRLLAVGAAATVVGLAAGLVLFDGDAEAVAADEVVGGISVADVSADDLRKVAGTRVYFAHQSVGDNILDGIPAVFAAHGVEAPPIERARTAPDATGGFLVHSLIGENTRPLGKIEDFAAVLRAGMGRQVDVAVLKLCYVDFTPGTDVEAVFAAYRDTVATLEKEFPAVTFVKATVPLTTQPGRAARFKQWVKGNDGYGSAANATRERLNELIRAEYRGGNLFDVAAVQSTGPDGSRVSGRHDGRPYFALHDGYAADPGHLNASGAQRVAAAWLAAVAKASPR